MSDEARGAIAEPESVAPKPAAREADARTSAATEPLVEMLFRNGTLTVVGIVVSFSLTFITQWAHNPIAWGIDDVPALVLLVTGIIAQARSLVTFLGHDSLRRSVYDRASRWFIVGLCLTATGVVCGVVVDFLQVML